MKRVCPQMASGSVQGAAAARERRESWAACLRASPSSRLSRCATASCRPFSEMLAGPELVLVCDLQGKGEEEEAQRRAGQPASLPVAARAEALGENSTWELCHRIVTCYPAACGNQHITGAAAVCSCTQPTWWTPRRPPPSLACPRDEGPARSHASMSPAHQSPPMHLVEEVATGVSKIIETYCATRVSRLLGRASTHSLATTTMPRFEV